MRNIRRSALFALASLLVFGAQVQAHPKYSVVNELDTECQKAGDTATASFVNDPTVHATALKMTGTGTALAEGKATFVNTTFHNLSVVFRGDCTTSLLPASLVVRVKFIPPGSTTVLDHGYDCARNIVATLPHGESQMLITTDSLCDCNERIPVGSQLVGIGLELVCNDTNPNTVHQDFIYKVTQSNLPVSFDLTTPSSSCGGL